jgi:hypothetical protein
MDAAIAAAASLAKVDQYEADYLEPELSPWESLLRDFSAESVMPETAAQIVKALGNIPALRSLLSLQLFNDPNHIYAHCWECNIKMR